MSIRLCGVKKSYVQGESTIPVLTGVDLHVDDASICVISGESGCGKTTLLSIIGGIEYPDSGELFVHGNPVHALGDDAINAFRKNIVSCIFQSHFLLNDFTALENLMLPLLIKGWRSKKAREKAREHLALVGLENRAEHRPSTLSGGECQRIAVARALITDAELILADEPTGNLDYANAHETMQLLQDLVIQQQKTLFLVTHNREFLALGTNAYELSQGVLHSIAT